MYYYFNILIFFSILGFIYENILYFVLNGSFTNNPFYGPWMPIYGFGIVIMVFLTRLVFNRFKMPRYAKIICLFFLTIILLTILEQLGGILTEAVFHKSFWDYRPLKFNYGKYIALEVSLGWGAACLIFLYLIKPWSDKIVKKIPHSITFILLFLITVDFFLSFFFLKGK